MDWERQPCSNDQFTRNEGRQIANALDSGNLGWAQQMINRDMDMLRGQPCEQEKLLHAIELYDRKGVGADIEVYRDNYNRVNWQVSDNRPMPYNGQSPCDRYQNYPCRPPQPEYRPYYEGRNYGYQGRDYGYQRPDPGAAIVEGLAIGMGAAIGQQIIRGAFGGGHHRYR